MKELVILDDENVVKNIIIVEDNISEELLNIFLTEQEAASYVYKDEVEYFVGPESDVSIGCLWDAVTKTMTSPDEFLNDGVEAIELFPVTKIG